LKDLQLNVDITGKKYNLRAANNSNIETEGTCTDAPRMAHDEAAGDDH